MKSVLTLAAGIDPLHFALRAWMIGLTIAVCVNAWVAG